MSALQCILGKFTKHVADYPTQLETAWSFWTSKTLRLVSWNDVIFLHNFSGARILGRIINKTCGWLSHMPGNCMVFFNLEDTATGYLKWCPFPLNYSGARILGRITKKRVAVYLAWLETIWYFSMWILMLVNWLFEMMPFSFIFFLGWDSWAKITNETCGRLWYMTGNGMLFLNVNIDDTVTNQEMHLWLTFDLLETLLTIRFILKDFWGKEQTKHVAHLHTRNSTVSDNARIDDSISNPKYTCEFPLGYGGVRSCNAFWEIHKFTKHVA